MAYGYRRTITIDHTKVGTTNSVNFPVLVSGTYAYLATVANGGKVTNSNGYDIIFTSDSSGGTLLNWEIETYTATSGLVNFWVKVPTVSATVDTVIYMFYGNSAISTFQGGATGSTWDSSFKAVYHMPNGTTLSGADSTTNANNLTNSGGVATTGQVDGAVSFNGAGSVLMSRTSGLTGIPNTQASQTIETWFTIAATAGSNSGVTFTSIAGGNANQFTHGSNQVRFSQNGGTNLVTPHSDPTINTFHHAVFTTTGTSHLFYYDGVQFSTGSQALQTGAVTEIYISTYAGTNEEWNGKIDEVRISSGVRSADWILAEYNNQSAPTTFYTLGAESSGTINQNNNGLNNISNLGNLGLNNII